jgi:hypothetical protein
MEVEAHDAVGLMKEHTDQPRLPWTW